jgi:hypothetical protein
MGTSRRTFEFGADTFVTIVPANNNKKASKDVTIIILTIIRVRRSYVVGAPSCRTAAPGSNPGRHPSLGSAQENPGAGNNVADFSQGIGRRISPYRIQG